MALSIKGRMKVKTLKVDFKEEFGLTLRVYDGRSFADDNATLAAIRKNDNKGGEFLPKRNTKVGNLEDKIMDIFGIKTQVAGSDDSYLCDNDFTLAKALEVDTKKMTKKDKKLSKETDDESSNHANDEEKIFSILFEWADKFNIAADDFPRNIDDLKSLDDINLVAEGITELPKEIGYLTNLTDLNLSGNELVELPKEIGNLSSLTNLDISSNQLAQLPKEIGNLTVLTELRLNNNKLTKYPREINSLTSLKDLNLSGNELVELPKEIGNLSSLTKLSLREIGLKELPKEIGNLSSLRFLIVAGNQLIQIPKEIGNLSSLSALDLTKNQLSELPIEVINLQSSSTTIYLDDIQLLVNGKTDDSSQGIKISMFWYIDDELGDVQEDGEFEPINLDVSFDENDIEESVYDLFSNTSFIQLAESLWTNYSKNKPLRLNIEIAKIEVGNNSYERNKDDWEDQYYLHWEDGSLVSNC